MKIEIEANKQLGDVIVKLCTNSILEYYPKQQILINENPMFLSNYYKDIKIDLGYKTKILVENAIIIEIKCVDELLDIHLENIISYYKIKKFSISCSY